MLACFFIISAINKVACADFTTEDVQYLNELPLDKLLRLKNSLQDLVTEYENVTATTPPVLQSFGAQAMAIKAPPIDRGDYETGIYKKESYSKVSHIFSMSITTLAFLAFGGYLLCLIVQAVRAKENYNPPPVQPTTFFLNAGIKKRPQQPQFASYGRRKRELKEYRSMKEIDLPPDALFSALIQFCEGYAKWSEKYENAAV